MTQQAVQEPPSKFITEEINLELKASIFYVDMDGMHDGQAIKTIISDLQPRRLVRLLASHSIARLTET